MFDFDAMAPNIVPSKYRQVSLATLDAGDSTATDEAMDYKTLHRHFVGREAYMRTRFIVVRHGSQTALIEIDRPASTELFSPIVDMRMLAGPAECAYVESPDTDVGIPSQLAAAAAIHVAAHPDVRCIVVEGKYSHVSFLLNPRPLRITVLDIVPPGPSKLADQARRVIDLAEDLPPILLIVEPVDSRDLLAAETNTAPKPAAPNPAAPNPAAPKPTGSGERTLLPCRVSGSDLDADTVRFLDERPPHENWTLLGCQRSQQIHSWFYGTQAPLVDTCPRRFLSTERDTQGVTLTRCCLLQEGIERRGRTALVPWGSSLAEVRAAIVDLIESEGFSWTPT